MKGSTKGSRLDTVLVERGLVASRERARAMILAGKIRVDGQSVTKAGAAVADAAMVTVDVPDHPYVGRGGIKLAHALDTFGIATAGRTALDVGASTGGFTDALLQRGALRVVALDVGHGQLDWKLRQDPRVLVLERINAKSLTADQLPAGTLPFDLATLDVSFISLRQIFPVLPPLLAGDADVIALVKPQFEVGREEVGKGGVVRDRDLQARVVRDVTAAAEGVGFRRAGMVESPITGMEGNREFLLHLRPARPL